jgi:uncharacterized membrane-anchored protein YitT (DUF2179 family)
VKVPPQDTKAQKKEYEVDSLKKKIGKKVANQNLGKILPEYFLLTIGSVILAINFDLFLAPFNIAPGGTSGAAIIIYEFTGWPKGLTMLILTLPMLVVGFFYLGRFRFLVRAFYVTLIYSLGADGLAIVLPAGVTKDLLLNALYGGITGGIGIGLIYRGGTSPAGTSVISRVIQLKTGIPNSQVYILIDGGVILIAGLVFGWEMSLYAFVTLFTWGFVADYVLEGPSVVRTVFIVTDFPEEISRVLMDRLGVGVTGWAVKGMFSKTEHTTLFSTVNRSDVNVLKAIVNDADPKAFVVIAQGHQTKGGMLRKQVRMTDDE